MRIGVRHTIAACKRCAGRDFDELKKGDSGPQAVLICSRCGAPTTRLLLLMSVSEEVVKESVKQRQKSSELRKPHKRSPK